MKSLVKAHAKVGIWMQDTPEPSYGDDDILIKVRKTSICGTDVHIHQWDKWAQRTVPVPMVVGHEYIGTVAAVGKNVKIFKPGDRVSGEGHIVCRVCKNCRMGKLHLCPNTIGVGVNRPGAFAEYLSLPAFNAISIPDFITDEVASIFDPFGNAVHTALSFDLLGKDVLITGAGPIGCMAVAICKHAGARHVVITDKIPYRLQLARKMGATLAVNIEENDLKWAMNHLGMTEGFEVGLEMSGNGDALNNMMDAVMHGGEIALLGIFPENVAINWDKVIFKGLFLKGIYGREMFNTWYQMIALIQSGLDITPVITNHYRIDDFQKGFDSMVAGQSGKVILDWAA